MKIRRLLPALAVVAALIVGCPPSVQRLFTDKDLVSEQKLIGTWADGETDAMAELQAFLAKHDAKFWENPQKRFGRRTESH